MASRAVAAAAEHGHLYRRALLGAAARDVGLVPRAVPAPLFKTTMIARFSSASDLGAPDIGEAAKESRGSEDAEAGEASRGEWISSTLRGSQVSEMTALGFYMGQKALSKGRERPDLEYFLANERAQVEVTDGMVARHRARPSLLKPLACAAGFAVGVGSAIAGSTATRAAAGAIRDAAEEHYNDALRQMMEEGTYHTEAGLKDFLKGQRDADRAPDGSPRAPGIETLRNPKDLTPSDAVGVAVKGVAELILVASRKV